MADSASSTEVVDSPANDLLHAGLGQLDAGDFHGAIEAFQSALRRRTDYPAAAHAYTGIAWISLKNCRRAVQQLSRAIKLDPRG